MCFRLMVDVGIPERESGCGDFTEEKRIKIGLLSDLPFLHMGLLINTFKEPRFVR